MFLTTEHKCHIGQLCAHLDKEGMLLRDTVAQWKSTQNVVDQLVDLSLTNQIMIRALEREVHVVIELIADIGNALIDALIMRDPGGYKDIVMILFDENVIDSTITNPIIDLVALRPILVQQYGSDSTDKVLEATMAWPTVLHFVQAVQQYIADA